MDYESTINEVIAQYGLTPSQRATVLQQVTASPCPWFRNVVYARTHAFAAQALASARES
jgi:hypothetical protein